MVEEYFVNTIRFDNWISKNNINTVDFAWIDVQGAENEVIDGRIFLSGKVDEPEEKKRKSNEPLKKGVKTLYIVPSDLLMVFGSHKRDALNDLKVFPLFWK